MVVNTTKNCEVGFKVQSSHVIDRRSKQNHRKVLLNIASMQMPTLGRAWSHFRVSSTDSKVRTTGGSLIPGLYGVMKLPLL